MTYTKALEDVDRRWGRPVTLDDYRRLGEKAAADLTADDLVIIEAFGGQKNAAEARARRQAALNPPAPVQTKAAARVLTMANVSDKVAAVCVDVIARSLEQPNTRIAELNAKIEDLTTRLAKIAPLQAGPRNRGTWDNSHHYTRGNVVMYAGDLWVTHAVATRRLPGTEGSGWLKIEKDPKEPAP